MKSVRLRTRGNGFFILKNFLGIIKSRNYEELVINVLIAFQTLEYRAFIKMHYLLSNFWAVGGETASPNERDGYGVLRLLRCSYAC